MKSKSKQAKQPTKYRREYSRQSYLPPAKRAQIVGLSFTDMKKSEIARYTGTNPQTVSRILSQPEVAMQLQAFQSRVMSMMPDALDGLHVLIKELDRTAIIEALYGARVFSEKKEIDVTRTEERTYSFPQVAFFGKFGRWPTMEEAKKFDKTLDVQPLVKASAG